MTKEIAEVIASIRRDWAKGDAKRDESLSIPENIEALYDISYGPYGTDNLLDIYTEKGERGIRPVIFNIHGGAWVYGSKEVYKYYCMSLVKYGFTVVNINYRLAPENVFPDAITDINAALTFVAKHGDRYNIDKSRVVLVGDSAGAHLASLYAAIFSNKEMAAMYDFELPDIMIKCMGLNCGIYDGRSMMLGKDNVQNLNELFGVFMGSSHGMPAEDDIKRVDSFRYIDTNYPPSYVMTSWEDFLFSKAEPMVRLLKDKGVRTEFKIYGSVGRTDLGHVFHVNCNLGEAHECNEDECNFFMEMCECQ